MDLGKEQSHQKLHQTLAPHPEECRVPEIMGTWRLRNRDQLRKRKAEAQEKQTSQWLLGEQKKRKYQRTGKGNQRGQKRQRNAEAKVEPPPQREKEVEKVPALAERDTEPPATEALPLPASPPEAVPAERPSELREESIGYQESPECHEPAVLSHSPETGQDVTEPEDLPPKMSLETAVCQDHSFKIIQDVAGPEVLSPKICQETAMCQDLASKVCQDMAEPEVHSPKTCQETALPRDLVSVSEDAADPKGCSPEVSPRAHVPEPYPLDTSQTIVIPEESVSEPDQEMAEAEGSFAKAQAIALSEDISAETHQEAVEPEYFSHKICKEIAVPTNSFQNTIQETPGSEEYSPEIDQETTKSEDYSPETYQEAARPEEYLPEIYQETPELENYSPETYQEVPEPEDLSIKTCKNREVPKDFLPEPSQGADGPQDQDPNARQENAKDVCTFCPEMREKVKAEEPEIPAIPHVPQENCPENDIYSYVLF